MTQIITWNVNGIRAIQKKGFLDWLSETNPDILCLQETKAHPDQLDDALKEMDSYRTFWASAQKKGYSGLATYTKPEPTSVDFLGEDAFDGEGRVQVIEYSEYCLVNAYFPNSQEKGKRIDYKIAFCEALLARCQEIEASGKGVILCGDYNIAHQAIDLHDPARNEGNPGYLPAERAWMDRFIDAGFVDCFRLFCDEPDQYTWWSYRLRARERNRGWRIDYHCVSASLVDKIESCEIMDQVMGSDHCPVRLTLKS